MSHVNGHERLYTLTSGRYSNLQDEKMAYLRNVRYIDTDGVSFGSRGTELFIWLFENVKSISELESVPAYIQANRDEVRQRLFKRGSFFESLKYACRNWYSVVYTLSDAAPGATKHSTYVKLPWIRINLLTFLVGHRGKNRYRLSSRGVLIAL